ncbi:histone-lysine N-methyltransferase SETD1B-like [Haliotis rufescens]|uniref:histone-lysine N-methyltransferase SETD1B-like n=1 Tax=Haliotis rufescens TaxID=6454 RepID=UPI00201FAA0A|nr:histone-lysine N-methyltransferase SETD1B-like [Haliotis rufescens]
MPPAIKPRRRQVPIPVPKPRKNTAVETSEDLSDEESAIGYTRSSEPSVPTEITVERPTEGESEEALEGDKTPTEEGREEEEPTDNTVHQNEQDEDRSETGATGSEDDREEQPNLQPEDASQPRRSTRTRSQPNWMRSGEYVLSAISDPGNPEWLARANYLNSLLADDRFRDQRHRVADTLLDLVSGKVK